VQFRTKFFVMVLGLFTQLSFAASIHSDPVQTSHRAVREMFSASAPERHSLTLIAFSPLVVKGQTLGEVLVYDDPATKRPMDYFELYDSTGELAAVGWFDRFGIQRIAVDRGMLDNTDKPEGAFVFFVDGDSI